MVFLKITLRKYTLVTHENDDKQYRIYFAKSKIIKLLDDVGEI
jgi:hypothetical protein